MGSKEPRCLDSRLLMSAFLIAALVVAPIFETQILASSFNIGDLVEVQNTGSKCLRVRDAPAGSEKGYVCDGTRGIIRDGPQSAILNGITYTWWRIEWENGLVGWSAEGEPGGVYYIKKVPPKAPVATSPGSSSEPGPTIDTLTPTLQWQGSFGADYYALAISKYPYGSSNIVYNPQVIYGTSHTVPSGILKPCEKYRWNLQAHSSGGWSPVSNTLYFQTGSCQTAPVLPDLTVGAVTVDKTKVHVGDSLTVTFTIKNIGSASSGSFRYRISLSPSPYGADYPMGYFSDSLAAYESKTLTKIVTVPSVSDGWYYVTVYVDDNGAVSESNEDNNIGSTGAPGGQGQIWVQQRQQLTVPSAPQNLVATAGDGRVTLSWSAPSSDGGSGITNYKIYRRTSSTSYSLIATIGNILTYTDTSVTNGATYCYQVSAVNSVGEGSKSNEACATPMGTSQQPPRIDTLSPSTITANEAPYDAELYLTGAGFNDVVEIAFSWTGAVSGSATWTKGSSRWNERVSIYSDSSMILRPRVVETSPTWSGTVYWTVTLRNSQGATASGYFKVTYSGPPPSPPDLTVTSVSFSPSSATGGQISVTFTVKNQGGSASGSFSVRISLANSTWGTTYSLGNFPMDSLNAGESRTVTIAASIPSSVPSGSYWVTVFADSFQQISESNENNNIGSSDPYKFTWGVPYTPTPTPQLTFTRLEPSQIETSESTYRARLEAYGTNFLNVVQIIWSWSGPDSNTRIWNKGDSNWNNYVEVVSDTYMILEPMVLYQETGTQTKTWTWTVTLKDSTGATASRQFTVTYKPQPQESSCPHKCWDRSALSGAELAALVRNHFPLGAVPQTGESIRVTAYAVARAESGGNPSACGDNGMSIGLWQIYTPAHPEYDKCRLFEEDYNAEAARQISSNGVNWNPWCVWEKTACGGKGNENYKAYLTEARKHFYPKVTSLSVSSSSISSGESVKIYYAVSDDAGLSRVELWRTVDKNGNPDPTSWQEINREYISGTSYSGYFSDTPSLGTYWYGIHVFDNSGAPEAWNDERNSRTGGYPGIYGPVKVVVNPAVSPPQQFDFTVEVSPSSGSVQQGGSVSATVTVKLTSGSPQTVALTASGLPSGAYATFSKSSGYPTFTSTLTISTSTTTPTGTFYIKITGSGGGLTRTATYTLTVTTTYTSMVTPPSPSTETGSLHVYVKDSNSNPIPGASVISTSQPSGQTQLSGITDSSGFIGFNGVRAGSYTIQAGKSGYQRSSSSVTVSSGQTTTATITLVAIPSPVVTPTTPQMPRTITLTLYVHEGSPNGPTLSGVRVTGHDGSGKSFDKTTDGGYVVIEGTAGNWHFRASKDGYKPVTWDQSITETCTKHVYLEKIAPPPNPPPVNLEFPKWIQSSLKSPYKGKIIGITFGGGKQKYNPGDTVTINVKVEGVERRGPYVVYLYILDPAGKLIYTDTKDEVWIEEGKDTVNVEFHYTIPQGILFGLFNRPLAGRYHVVAKLAVKFAFLNIPVHYVGLDNEIAPSETYFIVDEDTGSDTSYKEGDGYKELRKEIEGSLKTLFPVYCKMQSPEDPGTKANFVLGIDPYREEPILTRYKKVKIRIHLKQDLQDFLITGGFEKPSIDLFAVFPSPPLTGRPKTFLERELAKLIFNPKKAIIEEAEKTTIEKAISQIAEEYGEGYGILNLGKEIFAPYTTQIGETITEDNLDVYLPVGVQMTIEARLSSATFRGTHAQSTAAVVISTTGEWTGLITEDLGTIDIFLSLQPGQRRMGRI